MLVLFVFAFLGGLITIFAPCIWPILPLVLSSSTGGHRKPLGITFGIMLSFGILTLFISYLVKIIPFDTNLLRLFAVLVIGLFGFSLIIPKFGRYLEAYLSRLVGKFGNLNVSKETGFLSGLVTGLALGVVWTPCAGPILATIATLSATLRVNLATVLVTFFYLAGAGIPLFIFASLGNRVFGKTKLLSKYTGRVQQVFGVVMILTALLILTGYDRVLETKLLDYFPSYSNSLTAIESNPAVTQQLNSLKSSNLLNLPSLSDSSLFNADYPAPGFVGITGWLNTDKPLSLSALRGKVVLVDFWTYTCINCIRTLSHVTSWYDKYKDKGFVVIGVHTPEFAFEHSTPNIENAIKMFDIRYPVAQDNDYATWNNYNNEYWPAEYLIDANGNVRRTHFGEGEYDRTEMAIRELLKEAGQKVTVKLDNLPDQTPQGNLSPETYLNAQRMEYYYPSGNTGVVNTNFTLSENPPVNSFSLGGSWNISPQNAITGPGATLTYDFYANKVFLVLNPGTQGTAKIKVFLDDKVVNDANAGSDVKNGTVTVDSDRLYNLIDLKGQTGSHIVKLEFETPGTQVYAFTFG